MMKSFLSVLAFMSAGAFADNYPTTCSKICRAANGTQLCEAKKDQSRTDTTVFYTGPKGDNIITNVYPYNDMDQTLKLIADNAESLPEGPKLAVQDLLTHLTCASQVTPLVLSEGPDLQSFF